MVNNSLEGTRNDLIDLTKQKEKDGHEIILTIDVK